MSDFTNAVSQEDELESILNEVRGSDGSVNEEPSRNWSMEEIDRLLAGEIVEAPAADNGAASGGTDFNTDLFSIRPVGEETGPVPEMTDIFSGNDEVDGQESFFDSGKDDGFDPSQFELETFVIDEDAPAVQNKAEVFRPSAPAQTAQPAVQPAVQPAEPEEKAEEKKVIDYRKMFFEKLRPEDIVIPNEDDKDPEFPYDKSGIVVRKQDGSAEGDLDNIPTVMAAEDVRHFDEEKTRIAGATGSNPPPDIKPDEANVEGQIVLNGFVDLPEESIPEESNEEDVEENLWKRRKQKAKTFKIDDLDDGEFSDELNSLTEDLPLEDVDGEAEDTELPAEAESILDAVGEYTDPSEKSRIHTKLTELVRKSTRNAAVMGVLDLIMFIFLILPPLAEKLNAETAFFARNSLMLCVVNALFIILAVFLDGPRFFETFTSTLKGKLNGDSAVAIAVAVALIENALTAATLSNAVSARPQVFGAVAVFGLFLNKITDTIAVRRVLDNFAVCAFNYQHNMYAVHAFENESEVFELGRGLLMGNAEILYSSNINFPSDLIRNSEKDEDGDKHIKMMIIGSLIASLAVGVIIGIVKKEFMTGFAGFTASVCLSAPVFGKFIPTFITFISNKRLNKEGTVITSLEAAENIASSNAVVLDSADIFDRRACTMHGMKDFKSMRIDVVLLYAAAMVIKSGGPLKDCFEEVIDGRQDLLPPVRELVYEDKMGISARIYEQKVLLGNRNMLVHHNIKAPDKSFENKYTHDGRKVIYLACNEQLAAMFVVSYSVDENIKNYLKQLESNGIQILVRTNDVNVTEELISSRFGISPDNFKILSSVAGRLYKRRKDAVIESLSAQVIHDGGAVSMLKSIASACSMANKKKLGLIIQIAAMAAGILLTALIGCSDGGMGGVVAMLIMILEAVGVSGTLMIEKK